MRPGDVARTKSFIAIDGMNRFTFGPPDRKQNMVFLFLGNSESGVAFDAEAALRSMGLVKTEQPDGARLPNDAEVICPACTHQFRAIPEQVQRLMLGAGLEPPFAEPPPAAPPAPAEPAPAEPAGFVGDLERAEREQGGGETQ